MTKGTYWLADYEGTTVRVEGAALRDELTDHGWVQAAEPHGVDRVWLQHNVTRAFATFGADTLDGWHALGWEFAVPPSRRFEAGVEVDLPAPAPQTPDPAPVESPDATEPPPLADDKPTTETVKENTRAR